MNATCEAMHSAIESACGFGVRQSADRIIRFIEDNTANMIRGGTEPRIARMASYTAAQQFSLCADAVWQLVNQHFGTTGKQRTVTPEYETYRCRG